MDTSPLQYKVLGIFCAKQWWGYSLNVIHNNFDALYVTKDKLMFMH
jgi:hypothetical protein